MVDSEVDALPTDAAGLPETCDASILVLGYNSQSYLSDCLGSIPSAAVKHAVEVLFVNNGTDDSEAFIAGNFPEVRVLESHGNMGFAESNNRMARDARGKWVILLNPDTKLYPGAIDALIEAGEANPEFWLLAGVVVDRDGHFETNTYPALPSLKGLLRSMVGKAGRPFVFEQGKEIQEVEAIYGGFLLALRKRWEALGGFDESYFLYAEDCDLCKRASDAGGKIGIVTTSRIFHDVGSGNFFSPVRKRFQAAGNAHYFRRHFGPVHARAAILALWADQLVRFGVGAVLSPWKKKYGAMSKGHAQTALKPWIWMTGFNAPGADPRRKTRRS